MRRETIYFCVFFCLIAIQFPAYPAENPGFEFLRSETGARPASLGGAFVGVTGDVHSIFYNPAGIAFLRNQNLAATYLNNVMDFNVGSGAYVYPFAGTSSAGLGVQYFNYGEFQGKDRLGQDTGTFNANDIALLLSYGKLVRGNLGVGISLKYIQSKIAAYSSSAVAGDIGILYYFQEKNVTLGISAVNFGKTIDAFLSTKEALPAHLKFGLTKQLAHLPLFATGEARWFKEGEFYFLGGGEFQVRNIVRLRLGYSSIGRDQKLGVENDRWAGFSFGGGILINNMILDYSLTSMGGIGSQNRLTFSAFF